MVMAGVEGLKLGSGQGQDIYALLALLSAKLGSRVCSFSPEESTEQLSLTSQALTGARLPCEQFSQKLGNSCGQACTKSDVLVHP
jgi:hypothetical protein